MVINSNLFEIDPVFMDQKFEISNTRCILCNELSFKGDPIVWFKEHYPPWTHPECYSKFQEYKKLKENLFFYFKNNFHHESYEILEKINKFESEFDIKSDTPILKENFFPLLEKWIENQKNDQFLKKTAKKSQKTFEKKFIIKADEFISTKFAYNLQKSLEHLEELNELLNDDQTKDQIKNNTKQEIIEFENHIQQLQNIYRSESSRLYDFFKPKKEINCDPDTPYETRLMLKKLFSQKTSVIKWLDAYVDARSLENFITFLDVEAIGLKEISIITTTKIKDLENLKKIFKPFKIEMEENQNLSCNLKVVTAKDEIDIIHDRYLIQTDNVYSFSSFGYVYTKKNDIKLFEKESHQKHKDFFDSLWNSKNSLDIIKDWDAIQNITQGHYNKKSNFEHFPVNCSDCGIKTKVPFEPDGIRPVRCKVCLNNSKKTKF